MMIGIASGKTDGSLCRSIVAFASCAACSTVGLLGKNHIEGNLEQQQTAGDLEGADLDAERLE